MKFPRDTQFDTSLNKIQDLTWYPYIGSNYLTSEQRVFVFAHNIPVQPEDYEEKLKMWGSKDYWACHVEEYTYEEERYTKAFRSFIKSIVKTKFDYSSDADTLFRVDEFIKKICYLNYIQDLVVGNTQLTVANSTQIEKSKLINKSILNILKPTHCICWGRHVFNYIKQTQGFSVSGPDKILRKGFAINSVTIDAGHKFKLLKVYHPSMPSFSPYSEATQNIIHSFLED
jgi:hypothetical protein